ncbi:MAG TPA: hypothetical protein VMK53_02080, partial [Gemmatimonadales bacterium]|nr:hypothetical protein [Gemmatimonadales bacterium]
RVSLAGLDAWDGEEPLAGGFVASLVAGRQHLAAGRQDDARRELERARDLFPEFAGQAGPRWDLARLHQQRGDPRAAVVELSRITTHDETALAANAMEAELRTQAGDPAGAAAALERIIWITPYDPAVHMRLAALSTELGDHARAVQQRRAVMVLRPADRLEARYQLSRALFRAGQVAEARREVLGILEQAPGFEKAQALLLELRRPPGGGSP